MKKALKWTGIILLILIVLLAAAPFIFKDKIVARVKEEANKQLNAKMNFENFDLSLLRSFPDFSLRLKKFSLINIEPFAGDTLIYTDELDVTVDIMSIIKGDEIRIKSILLDHANINFLVNKDGKANWDIAKASEPGTATEQASAFKGNIKKYSIQNSKIVYDDKSLDFYLKLEGLNHTGKGDFTQDLFVLNTLTDIQSADMNYGGVGYISRAKAKIEADLEMDMKNFKFTFKDNKVNLNALELGVNGFVAMPDTNIDMELQFSAAQSDFKNFISMIPAVYKSDMNSMQASGSLALKGHLKGRYNAVSFPGYGLELLIQNGMFQYSSLPSKVENVQVDLKVNNPDGVDDHTLINLSKFHVEMAGDPFDAALTLKNPVSDPDLDAFMKGKINLGNISKIVPLEKGTRLSGLLSADLKLKGKTKTLEQGKYEQFDANGNFSLNEMEYADASGKSGIKIHNMLMTFSPRIVSLTSFQAETELGDIAANGSLENFIPYAINGSTLKGQLNLNSTGMNLNSMMNNDGSTQSTDTSAMAVLEIPANIDFTMNASIGKLIYQDITMNNFKGSLIVRDQIVRMQQVGMQLLDGSMSMNGTYSSKDISRPTFEMDLNIKDFDIQKTAKAFPTVRQMAPIASYCTGSFSTSMNAKGILSENMQPLMNTLNGGGRLTTSKITVKNFASFEKIADALKINSLRSVDIPSVNPSFKFIDGRVYVDPVDMQVNGMKTTLAGSNGFDQTIDYTMAMQVPRSAFGGAANSVLNNMVNSANAKGANFSLGETVPLNILIKGTVTDPKISTDLASKGGAVMDDLKAKAKEEFDKKKAEAEARAREEAERLKQEAASKLDEEKAKAAAEADRLKKEAEAKAKAAADSAKKAAEQKAKDALKDINPFKKK